MNSREWPSRRDLLRQAGVLALGAFGVGATRMAGAPRADGGKRKTITLSGSSWRHIGGDDSADVPSAHGERVTMSGVLRSPSGERVGTFRGTSYRIDGSLAADSDDSCVEFHTFELTDGTIIGTGVCTGAMSTCAVLGGTGSYAGACGTYTCRQAPIDYGGDGSADFEFTLT